MTHDKRVKPLRLLVQWYLCLWRATSLRALLLGVDPSETPEVLRKYETPWFNRSTLVDVYALCWPVMELAALCCGFSLFLHSAVAAALLGLIVLYRLNEIAGGIIHVMLHRAAYDYVDERKLALTVLTFLEPIVLFALLHVVVGSVVPATVGGAVIPKVYDCGPRPWGPMTALHFSVACYTTVGWGDVQAVHWSAMAVSSAEAVFGLVMVVSTISTFVSRAWGSPGGRKEGEQEEGGTRDRTKSVGEKP